MHSKLIMINGFPIDADKMYYGDDIIDEIEKIREYYENRICENCKHLKDKNKCGVVSYYVTTPSR